MIKILKNEELNFKDLSPYLDEKNFIIISPDMVTQTTAVIKGWIAMILSEYYDKDPNKMINDGKYKFQFRGNNLLTNEFILITNK
ncbi:MAG: hypothetical protein WC917_00800 [Bacilli bacterium]|jgi:hypothetical protein